MKDKSNSACQSKTVTVETQNAKPSSRLLIIIRHSLPLFPITQSRSALQFSQKSHSLSVDSLGELGNILSTLMFVMIATTMLRQQIQQIQQDSLGYQGLYQL